MIATINTGVTDIPGMTEEATRYFRDLYDHLIRVADQVDNYRDLLSSVMDTHLSTVSNRLNVVMKQLTIIATIFLPLSFLTGFFGQNFALLVRWIGSTWSFWVFAVAVDIVTVVGLIWCSAAAAGWVARRSDAVAPPEDGRVDRSAAPGGAEGQALRPLRRVGLVAGPPVLAAVGHREAELLAPVHQGADLLLVLAHERQRPGVAVADTPGGPERLLQAPGLAAGLDDGVGAVGDVGPDVGVTVGQEVGGAQPAVVLVDAQEPRLDFEQARPRRPRGRPW